MTFRPSVVPDRDNDIISTFTRSFESARNLVRKDQADKRARVQFEQETRLREQDIEDRERDAAIASGQTGTFDPESFQGRRSDQDIAGALAGAGRDPVDQRDIFAGQVPDRGPTEGQPRLIQGQAGAPNIFAQAGQETRATAGAQPALIAGVGGAPEVVTPPEFGVGGVGVITEPSSEDRLEPGFLPAGDLPEDAVRLPGGRMFSESLRRQRLREEGAEDIGVEAAAVAETPPGERAAAGEARDVTEFEGRTPAQAGTDRAEADAFRTTFPVELEGVESDLEAIFRGNMLTRQAELLARNEGLGSTAGRQREQNVQRIVERLRIEAGFAEGVPPGAEGQRLVNRWRAIAEAQVDALAEGDDPEQPTRDLISQADLAAMTDDEIAGIQSTATSFIQEIEDNTRNLSSITEELGIATARERRVITPLLLEKVTEKWLDPIAPWSDPENRPGVGFTVFGGRAGGDVFAEARSPQDIVDLIMGTDERR